DEDRQEQVGDWPGEHHDEPLPQGLGRERAAALTLAHLVAGIFAEDLHVAAEGDDAEAILGLAAAQADEGAAEADREAQHLEVEELGGEKVAKLVAGDQYADKEQEMQDRHGWRLVLTCRKQVCYH